MFFILIHLCFIRVLIKFVIFFKNVLGLFLKYSKRYKKIRSTLLFFNKRYLVCDYDLWDYTYSREAFSVLMEISWYRTRRHAGETLALRGKKKKGQRRSSVNGIVLDRRTFFLRPGPSLFLHSLPRFRLPRLVLGERTLGEYLDDNTQ